MEEPSPRSQNCGKFTNSRLYLNWESFSINALLLLGFRTLGVIGQEILMELYLTILYFIFILTAALYLACAICISPLGGILSNQVTGLTLY